MRTFRLLAVIYFYPRPPRGGRLLPATITEAAQEISIHALREEGDSSLRRSPKRRRRFLSTPSARRATAAIAARRPLSNDFYPRPPRGGRRYCIAKTIRLIRFLSTPSARRATWAEWLKTSSRSNFYPRPPRGGRPITDTKLDELTRISIHALREEGDLRRCDLPPPDRPISIHALREEGDQYSGTRRPSLKNFYPRPPRGGRRSNSITGHQTRRFLSTPSARRATIRSTASTSNY